MLLEKIKKNIYFYFPNEISKRYFLCLSLLFLFSFFIRFFGIDWDNGFLFHPDERAIFMHAYGYILFTLLGAYYFMKNQFRESAMQNIIDNDLT